MKVHTRRITVVFPNGTIIAAHTDEEFSEVSVYRSNGNTDIYEAHPVGLYKVQIGKYLRTDYRS